MSDKEIVKGLQKSRGKIFEVIQTSFNLSLAALKVPGIVNRF
jgi:hypothetical protein